MVTTHRLLWIDASAAPSAGASCSLPLAAVQHAQLKGRMLAKMPLGTPKVHLTVATGADRRAQAGPPCAALLPAWAACLRRHCCAGSVGC